MNIQLNSAGSNKSQALQVQRIRLDHGDDDEDESDPVDDVTLTDVLYLFVAMKLSSDQDVCHATCQPPHTSHIVQVITSVFLALII